MTKDQQAALEQAAREWLDTNLPSCTCRHSIASALVTLLAAQRAAVLEEVAKMGQDFISAVYPSSPSHAKGATEILELLRQQAQEQRP